MYRLGDSFNYVFRHFRALRDSDKHAINLNELKKQYKKMERPVNAYGTGNAILADSDFESPVGLLVSYVTQGEYPPPETLLSACLSISEYYEAKGAIGLEECLFGKPLKGIGIESLRLHKLETANELCCSMIEHLQEGHTKEQAAMLVIEEKELAYDPADLVRIFDRYREKLMLGDWRSISISKGDK